MLQRAVGVQVGQPGEDETPGRSESLDDIAHIIEQFDPAPDEVVEAAKRVFRKESRVTVLAELVSDQLVGVELGGMPTRRLVFAVGDLRIEVDVKGERGHSFVTGTVEGRDTSGAQASAARARTPAHDQERPLTDGEFTFRDLPPGPCRFELVFDRDPDRVISCDWITL